MKVENTKIKKRKQLVRVQFSLIKILKNFPGILLNQIPKTNLSGSILPFLAHLKTIPNL